MFWIVTLCGLKQRYQHFRNTLLLSAGQPASAHGVTNQKTNVCSFTAVRTSDLIQCNVFEISDMLQSRQIHTYDMTGN